MTALLTLEEIKAHLRVDHDADDDMLMDKVRQATTAVLLAYIQGSRDKVIREDGELIPGEALTLKGAAMRLTGCCTGIRILRSGKNCFRELPFSVSVLIYDLRCPTVL